MLEQSSQELELLIELTKGGKLEHRYRERLLIIKTYLESNNKRGTGRDLGIDIQVVRRWLTRWDDGELVRNDLYEIYSNGSLKRHQYKKELLGLVKDKARSGSPGKFTAAQREQIIALASESPEEIGLPFTHWSEPLLRIELISRGIVEDISVRQVGRFLKSAQASASKRCLLGTPEYR